MDFLASFPEVDFKGQQLSERLYQAIIISFSVVGFFVGYAEQDFKWTFQIWLAGCCIAFLVSLPPWPWFRRRPVHWQKSLEEQESAAEAEREAAAQTPAQTPAPAPVPAARLQGVASSQVKRRK